MHLLTKRTELQPSLPENGNSPCARMFAVCNISGTRQTSYLPCVSTKTHGKQRTLGKLRCLPFARTGHTANTKFRRVLLPWHTAKPEHVPCACSSGAVLGPDGRVSNGREGNEHMQKKKKKKKKLRNKMLLYLLFFKKNSTGTAYYSESQFKR